MTYSKDFIKCALNIYNNKLNNNLTVHQILQLINISRSTLYIWVNNKLNLDKEKKKKKKYDTKVTNKCKETIIEYMKKNKNNNSIKKLKKIIRRIYKIKISKSYIYNILKECKVTNKRTQEDHCPYSEEKIKEKANIVKNQIDSAEDTIIYIDESSICIGSKSNYGWSKKGTKCKVKNIHGKHNRFSLVMGITKYGIMNYTLKKGSFNAITFKKFLKYKLNGKYSFFMDNAKIHHAKLLDKELKNKIIYNVPYLSVCNPIEMIFNTLKKYLSSIIINCLSTLRKHLSKFMSHINSSVGLQKYITKAYDDLCSFC